MEWTLPWPPSVNHYWVRTKRGVTVGAAGKEYRRAVEELVQPKSPLSGRLIVDLIAHPPDKRRRDIDNIQKAIWDSLQSAGVYEDDSQIDELRVKRGEVMDGGCVFVWIEEM